MWFKNAIFYRLSDFNFNENELADAMAKDVFKPCLPRQEKTVGWVSPLGDKSEMMVFSANIG